MNPFKEIREKFKGQWILVTRDFKKVYAHSKSPKELDEQAVKLKDKDLMITVVPSDNSQVYVG